MQLFSYVFQHNILADYSYICTVESKDKEIKRIAFPAIITNISVPLMSMADVAVVGHIGAASYIGAVAIGASVFNMIYWLLNFLRIGSSGMTAQAFGRNDRTEIRAIFYRGFTLALGLSLVILLFNRPIGRAMIDFMDPDAATRTLAEAYFTVAVWGAPAVLVTYVLSGWLLGMQNSRAIMLVSIIINVINICLSVTFVFALGWEIKGVAAATAVSQWLGAFALAGYIAKKYRVAFPGRALIFRLAEFKKLISVNADIFLRTLCLVLVTVWFTRSGARQGVDILSANALLMQLFTFFSYFIDGFAFAGEALAGKYYGASSRADLSHLVKSLFKWGIALSLVFMAAYFFAGNALLSLLTDNRPIIDICDKYIGWAAVIPVAGVTAFVFDGVFVGMMQTRAMLVSIAFAAVVFFAVYFIFDSRLGNHALWLAFVLYLATRGVVELLLYSNKLRHLTWTK